MQNKNGIRILDKKPKLIQPNQNKLSKQSYAKPIPNNKRKHFWDVKLFVNLLWEIQKERCWFCGRYVKLVDATIDHKHPQSKHGSNTYNNCVMSCYTCNHSKANQSVTEYRKKKKIGGHYTDIVMFYGESEHSHFQCNLSTMSGGSDTLLKNVNNTSIQKVLPLF